jgi:hypothetical protein
MEEREMLDKIVEQTEEVDQLIAAELVERAYLPLPPQPHQRQQQQQQQQQQHNGYHHGTTVKHTQPHPMLHNKNRFQRDYPFYTPPAPLAHCPAHTASYHRGTDTYTPIPPPLKRQKRRAPTEASSGFKSAAQLMEPSLPSTTATTTMQ